MKTHRWIALLTALACLLVVLPALAEREDDAERKSKNGKTAGTVDGVSVVVEYGRPQVKDREIWGALVPYDKVWRTGADEATTVTFGGKVKVGGKTLDAGTYSLFTIPAESGDWTVVLNSVAEQWGAYDYDPAKDVVRFEVKPEDAEWTEELTFTVDDDHVVLHWGKVKLPFAVSAAG